MKTKYKIGDVLAVRDVSGNVLASDIKSISIKKGNNVIYMLSNKQEVNEASELYEDYDIRIVKKVASLNQNDTKDNQSVVTKYDVGDILQTMNYYDDTYAADITMIYIDKDGVRYLLSNGDWINEISVDDSWAKIVGKVGTLNTNDPYYG